MLPMNSAMTKAEGAASTKRSTGRITGNSDVFKSGRNSSISKRGPQAISNV